jgi:hypothetical protein
MTYIIGLVKIFGEGLCSGRRMADDDDDDLHTYHSRFMPETSRVFLRDTHILLKLLSYKK